MIATLRSPLVASSSFGLDVWVTGAPIVADSAPDASTLTSSRICMINPYARGGVQAMGSGLIRVLAIGGTSVTYQAWFYDYALNGGQWVAWGINRTITVGTTNLDAAGNTTIGAMLGSKWFMQIVSQVGGVTNFGYGYV